MTGHDFNRPDEQLEGFPVGCVCVSLGAVCCSHFFSQFSVVSEEEHHENTNILLQEQAISGNNKSCRSLSLFWSIRVLLVLLFFGSGVV